LRTSLSLSARQHVAPAALDHVEGGAADLHPVAIVDARAHDALGERGAVLRHDEAVGQLHLHVAALDGDRAHALRAESGREDDVVAGAGAEGVHAGLHDEPAGQREPSVVASQALVGARAPILDRLHPLGVGGGGQRDERGAKGEGGDFHGRING